MRVECVRNIGATTGEEIGSGYWLTVGKTLGGRIELRLIPNDGRTPALFDSRQFKTVCSKVPSNWRAIVDEQGNFRLTPEVWTRRGYWEDYFNLVPEAIEEFEREKAKMLAEVG
jgi:hypothetical protein